MEPEIVVDRDRCMGSGQCVYAAPGVFDQDDQAISIVVDPRGEPEHRIVRAVTSCPVEAISLRLGGITVGARDLWGWERGVHSDDPLVETFWSLSVEHERLREQLASIPEPGGDGKGRVRDLIASLQEHLSSEEHVAYPVLVDLVGPGLVEAFDADHAAMTDLVDDSDVAELVRVLDQHIRLEETILFPVALAVLRRRTEAGRV